jgi:MtN3 and saliva related transmembrane protein
MTEEWSLTAVVGGSAATVSTLSLLPQVVKTWRTRSAEDISLMWLLAALFGMALWIAYGLMLPSWAVIGGNLFPFCFALTLLVLKLQHRR